MCARLSFHVSSFLPLCIPFISVRFSLFRIIKTSPQWKFAANCLDWPRSCTMHMKQHEIARHSPDSMLCIAFYLLNYVWKINFCIVNSFLFGQFFAFAWIKWWISRMPPSPYEVYSIQILADRQTHYTVFVSIWILVWNIRCGAFGSRKTYDFVVYHVRVCSVPKI